VYTSSLDGRAGATCATGVAADQARAGRSTGEERGEDGHAALRLARDDLHDANAFLEAEPDELARAPVRVQPADALVDQLGEVAAEFALVDAPVRFERDNVGQRMPAILMWRWSQFADVAVGSPGSSNWMTWRTAKGRQRNRRAWYHCIMQT
jgi:hypothetical protein